jgi:PPM family protein phosphatase
LCERCFFMGRSASTTRSNMIALECGQQTSQGRRAQNEDSVAWNEFDGGVLAIVADGMGGGIDGKLFSSTAVARIQATIISSRSGVSATALRNALQAAIDELRNLRASDPRYEASGTTLVIAGVTVAQGAANAHIIHIGDSRAYLIRAARQVELLTRDHSYGEELIRAGMRPEEAEQHPQALRLTHALGDDLQFSEVPEPEHSIELAPGDSLLLCTDGVSKKLSNAEFIAAVAGRSAQQAASQVVEQALRNGSNDNVSALVIQCKPVVRKASAWASIGAAIAVALVVALGGLVFSQVRQLGEPPLPTQGPTITALVEETRPAGAASSTPNLGTSSTAVLATITSSPTATDTPTVTPTNTRTPPPTRVPATAAPVPPTATSSPATQPLPTDTPVSTVPTDTPVVPTAEAPTATPEPLPPGVTLEPAPPPPPLTPGS